MVNLLRPLSVLLNDINNFISKVYLEVLTNFGQNLYFSGGSVTRNSKISFLELCKSSNNVFKTSTSQQTYATGPFGAYPRTYLYMAEKLKVKPSLMDYKTNPVFEGSKLYDVFKKTFATKPVKQEDRDFVPEFVGVIKSRMEDKTCQLPPGSPVIFVSLKKGDSYSVHYLIFKLSNDVYNVEKPSDYIQYVMQFFESFKPVGKPDCTDLVSRILIIQDDERRFKYLIARNTPAYGKLYQLGQMYAETYPPKARVDAVEAPPKIELGQLQPCQIQVGEMLPKEKETSEEVTPGTKEVAKKTEVKENNKIEEEKAEELPEECTISYKQGDNVVPLMKMRLHKETLKRFKP